MRIEHPKAENLSSLKALWQEAFGDTEKDIDLFFQKAFDTERCLCILDNERAVAALYWFDCEYKGEKAAYLYAIATLKSHRGRGLCRQLMDKTHDILKKSGYVCVILVPGEKSLFDFYVKMGYRVFSCADEKYVIADDRKIPLKRIESLEYGRIRRELLPTNGVVQEKENLDYLSVYAELYKGEDFLCACVRNGDSVCITELLGNTEAAEKIICTLGCKDGFVRVWGNGREFSMYLPLYERQIDMPAYFGLAFD